MSNLLPEKTGLSAYEELELRIRSEFKTKQQNQLKELLLKPFTHIKNLLLMINDSISIRMIPNKVREEVLQNIIEESRKEEQKKLEENRKPDIRVQEFKKEILKNEQLTLEEKLEILCRLSLASGKDITVALTKETEPDCLKSPDAILLFERQDTYVQIQYAPKEIKMQTAQPSYNFTIKGGINYDKNEHIESKGLDEVIHIFKTGLMPDMEKIYIDKDTVYTEATHTILQNTVDNKEIAADPDYDIDSLYPAEPSYETPQILQHIFNGSVEQLNSYSDHLYPKELPEYGNYCDSEYQL